MKWDQYRISLPGPNVSTTFKNNIPDFYSKIWTFSGPILELFRNLRPLKAKIRTFSGPLLYLSLDPDQVRISGPKVSTTFKNKIPDFYSKIWTFSGPILELFRTLCPLKAKIWTFSGPLLRLSLDSDQDRNSGPYQSHWTWLIIIHHSKKW